VISVWDPLLGFSDHGNELSDSIKQEILMAN